MHKRIHYVLPGTNQLQSWGFFCAQYAQNKMYTREPGSQQGKSFRKEGSALHLAIAIQSQKGCYVNHQTGCPEMLWNPHHFKEEIRQVSGLRTGKKIGTN